MNCEVGLCAFGGWPGPSVRKSCGFLYKVVLSPLGYLTLILLGLGLIKCMCTPSVIVRTGLINNALNQCHFRAQSVTQSTSHDQGDDIPKQLPTRVIIVSPTTGIHQLRYFRLAVNTRLLFELEES
jgi:hypothetical protein